MISRTCSNNICTTVLQSVLELKTMGLNCHNFVSQTNSCWNLSTIVFLTPVHRLSCNYFFFTSQISIILRHHPAFRRNVRLRYVDLKDFASEKDGRITAKLKLCQQIKHPTYLPFDKHPHQSHKCLGKLELQESIFHSQHRKPFITAASEFPTSIGTR